MSAKTVARTQSVNLTDEQLTLLDGAGDEKLQAKVDAAKARIAAQADRPDLGRGAALVSDVAEEARTNGRVFFFHRPLRRCPICDQRAGYAVYRSGPRRGRSNYDRPLYLNGVEFAHRTVTMEGYVAVGACRECVDGLLPEIRQALVDIRAEVPAILHTTGRPHYVWYANRRCTKCGWTGHEGQMGRLPTLMGGSGSYPAKCPQCNAANLLLALPMVELAEGFTVVEPPRRQG